MLIDIKEIMINVEITQSAVNEFTDNKKLILYRFAISKIKLNIEYKY